MTLAISIDRLQYRFDSTRVPRITAGGITDNGRVKIENWEYLIISNGTFAWHPPNRSKKNLNLELRNVFFPAWVKSDDVTEQESTATIQNTGEEGWKGAYYNTTLSTTQCAIEAKYELNSGSVGISIQSGTVQDNYTAVGSSVEHSAILSANFVGSIWELGTFVKNFPFQPDDRVIIEITDTDPVPVVRYFLVKPDGKLFLLRTTRSKLTAAPKAHVLTYSADSYLTDIQIYNNEKISASTETICVVSRLQSWEDNYSLISNADTIEKADGSIEETFPASKNILRTLTATRKAAPREQRDLFVDAFEWHRNSQEFIFVDNARKDRGLRLGESEEFWARFSSPFGDSARRCLFGESVQIIEVQRDDYVPVELDLTPPTVFFSIGVGSVGGDVPLSALASDELDMSYVEFWADGILIATVLKADAFDSVYSAIWNLDLFATGTYTVYAKAFDAAGNATISNTEEFTINRELVIYDSEIVTYDGGDVYIYI